MAFQKKKKELWLTHAGLAKILLVRFSTDGETESDSAPYAVQKKGLTPVNKLKYLPPPDVSDISSALRHMYNSRGREFIKRHLLQTNGYAPIPPFQLMPPKTHKTCDSVPFSTEDMHHSERRIERNQRLEEMKKISPQARIPYKTNRRWNCKI